MGHHEREKTFTALVQIDKFLPNSFEMSIES